MNANNQQLIQNIEKCSGFREGGEWFLCAFGPCFRLNHDNNKMFIRKGTSTRTPCIPEWRKVESWEIPEQIKSQVNLASKDNAQ